MSVTKFLPKWEFTPGRRGSLRWWASGLALALAVFTVAPLQAQQTGQVTGNITSVQTGLGLGDVQVSITGTGLGALTNQEGRFLILNVPAGEQEVVAQLIGYGEERQTVTVPAGDVAVVNLTLRTRAVELEGMVVTGTATGAQRREVGNSISLITAEQIEALPVANVEDILRGRTLGLTVTGSAGQPGAGSNITIRGLNSVSGRNHPLIYIDGVRMLEGMYEEGTSNYEGATAIGSIDPRDIERIEVIKGAAASTIYGSEASAGVIQIFTKRGRAGAPRWTFTMDQSIADVGHIGPDSDPTGLQINDCATRGPFWPDSIPLDPSCPAGGSWVRLGHGQRYDINVRGGSEDLTYYLSTGYMDEKGTVEAPRGGAKMYTLRSNFQFNGFENFQIRLNGSYTRQDLEWIPNGDSDRGLMYNVARLYEDNTENNDALVFDQEQDQYVNHFNFSANLNWNPMDNMRHRLNVGLDWSNSHFITWMPWGYFDYWNTGYRVVDIENRRILTTDYAGSFSSGIPFLGEDFNSVFSVGGQFMALEDTGNRSDAYDFAGPGTHILNTAAVNYRMQEDYRGRFSGGFFIQEQFGWKNRFFVTAGVRADSHSDFGEDLDHQYFFLWYPKLQATYTVSDHSFWPTWWETFRVRAAYGEAGEPPRAGIAVVQFQPSNLADENELGLIIINQGNPEVGPERAKEYEVGMDGSFLMGKVNYTTTAYKRTTYEGLINVSPAGSNGIAENIYLNIGEWESKGFEGALDLLVYDGLDVQVSLNTRYQWNETKMLKLYDDPEQEMSLGYFQYFRTGYPLPSMWDRKLTNGDSLGVLPAYTDTTEYYGPSYPPHEASMGIQTTLWNRLTFDAFLFSQWGHRLYDDLGQEIQRGLGFWAPCKEIDQAVEDYFNDVPGASIDHLTARQIGRCSQRYSRDRDWMSPGDYIRLSALSASYRLPEDWLARVPGGFDQATVQFTVQNVALWSRFRGLDPDALMDTSLEIDRAAGYIMPPPRRFTFNLRMNF